MKLSILDQTRVYAGSNAAETLQACIELAKWAERWGYHRFWVTEHHNSSHFASASPEVLMARLAAETTRIRIGAGGVLLPYHATLKVAENFSMLEALYPGRIDLGIGRGGNESLPVRQLLNPHHTFDLDVYKKRILELSGFLANVDTCYNGEQVKVVPAVGALPESWLLSSGTGTAMIAAGLGMPLCYAHFINPNGRETVQAYHDQFKGNNKPAVMVAVFVVCAREKSTVERLLNELVLAQQNPDKAVSGTPREVGEKLSGLARMYDAAELMLLVHTGNHRDKWETYQLVAEACL